MWRDSSHGGNNPAQERPILILKLVSTQSEGPSRSSSTVHLWQSQRTSGLALPWGANIVSDLAVFWVTNSDSKVCLCLRIFMVTQCPKPGSWGAQGQSQSWTSGASLGRGWGQAAMWAHSWAWLSETHGQAGQRCGPAAVSLGQRLMAPGGWSGVPGEGQSGLWVPSGSQHSLNGETVHGFDHCWLQEVLTQAELCQERWCVQPHWWWKGAEVGGSEEWLPLVPA